MSLYVILSGAVRVNRESEGGGGTVEVERLGAAAPSARWA